MMCGYFCCIYMSNRDFLLAKTCDIGWMAPKMPIPLAHLSTQLLFGWPNRISKQDKGVFSSYFSRLVFDNIH